MSWHEIVVWLVVGLVAGWLAGLVLGGGGLIRNLVAGLLGSIVGGFIFSHFGIHVPIENFWIREILISTVGAIIVIAIARFVA